MSKNSKEMTAGEGDSFWRVEYSPRDGIHTAVNCHYQAQPGRSKQKFLQSSIVSGQKVGRNRNENAGKGIWCEFYKNT